MADILAVEPFFGGSHKLFLEGLCEHSRHRFHLLTHPAVFWKWRMRGAAVTLSDQARRVKFPPCLVLASDMLSLAEFMALYGKPLPAVIYMHENQLSYPAPEAEADQRDIHFGFTNLTSCLAASQIIWNSAFHRDAFMAALPAFLAAMPDQRPKGVKEKILEKSLVIPPGLDLSAIDRETIVRDGSPIVLWNHRWEFDKKPEVFFAALYKLADEGLDFRVAILGENFQVKPQAFLEARERLGARVVHYGFVEDRAEYIRWLRRSSVSVSTAEQENFGISVIEAAYAGATPLWPDRLSYPGLVPPSAGRAHLYSDFPELVVKLRDAIARARINHAPDEVLKKPLARYDWPNLIGDYDGLFDGLSPESKKGAI